MTRTAENHLSVVGDDHEMLVARRARHLVDLLDEHHGHPGGEVVRGICVNVAMLVAQYGLDGAVDVVRGSLALPPLNPRTEGAQP